MGSSWNERVRQHADLWCDFLSRGEDDIAVAGHAFAGRRILITGAGGFIGSALARVLARFAPAELVLVDVAEYGLHTLEQELSCIQYGLSRSLLLGSVTDAAFLHETFAAHRPEIVFHAAALKHVPLAEWNPIATAATNVLGTVAVIEAATEFAASQLILLSTDKATDPIGVLGATKRFAECLVDRDTTQTVLKAVRLPNVLGSSGSVGPLFHHQISMGRPVTVTHPDVTRFFFSVGQSVETLLAAAASPLAHGILVPSVGPPYRILDLARFLIAHVPSPTGPPAAIVLNGLRPGDKLHEQMLSTHETTGALLEGTSLRPVSRGPFDRAVLHRALTHIRHAINRRDRDELSIALHAAVPEYAPLAQNQGAPESGSRTSAIGSAAAGRPHHLASDEAAAR